MHNIVLIYYAYVLYISTCIRSSFSLLLIYNTFIYIIYLHKINVYVHDACRIWYPYIYIFLCPHNAILHFMHMSFISISFILKFFYHYYIYNTLGYIYRYMHQSCSIVIHICFYIIMWCPFYEIFSWFSPCSYRLNL